MRSIFREKGEDCSKLRLPDTQRTADGLANASEKGEGKVGTLGKRNNSKKGRVSKWKYTEIKANKV